MQRLIGAEKWHHLIIGQIDDGLMGRKPLFRIVLIKLDTDVSVFHAQCTDSMFSGEKANGQWPKSHQTIPVFTKMKLHKKQWIFTIIESIKGKNSKTAHSQRSEISLIFNIITVFNDIDKSCHIVKLDKQFLMIRIINLV